MQIQHHDNHEQGEFFILDEQGNKLAELTYFYVNSTTINANHTYVSTSLRGQGVADKLYQALVDFLQQQNLSLIPSCSYIQTKWQREQLKYSR